MGRKTTKKYTSEGLVFLALKLAAEGVKSMLQRMEEKSLNHEVIQKDISSLTPREFERYVAGLIERLPGWKSETTQASRDQGCDVVAISPHGMRYAIQVKHHQSTVGNKAVQEIAAARALYKAQHAIVVTSGPGFTRSAQTLASANHVVLWTQQQLSTLHSWGEARFKTKTLPGF